jgi:type I restriction enzyme S subunit
MPTGGSLLLGVGSAADSISTNGVFSSGDILFGKLRPQLRKCVRVQTPGYCSTDILVLRPNAGIDPTYAGYVVQSEVVFSAAIRTEEGTKMPRCSWHDLKKVNVFLPKEGAAQKKIAAVLESIDTAIEKTEALIAKHQQIKAGLMHDLFTRGVLPNGQLRPPRSEAPELYQETALGWIPAEWRVSKLDDVCKSIVDCPHSTPNFQPSGVLVARTMHIKNSVFLEHEASRVSESEYQERISRAEPLPGDVVFTREAPVGEAFVIPKGMRICLGQRVMLVKPNAESLDSDYLVAQIYAGALSTRIAELTAGTTNPHLNVADVRALLIALPSPQEQTDMKGRINAMNARIRSEETILLKLQKQKLGLMQDLLTGRVPVPAAPEPAEAAA